MAASIAIKPYFTHRLIKLEDLNHHRTLYAGRMSEWFVEAGFIAASTILPPEEIVCVKIHGLHFRTSATSGQTLQIRSRIAHLGSSSIMVYVDVCFAGREDRLVDGFLSFVHVGEDHKPKPHNLTLDLVTREDRKIEEKAKLLQKQSREEALLSIS
ncbi:MAG: acyl-CoA thioesterase [Oligoflexales bacterium]|nr:acyl-CoA thioesterase [Oligoflexales bacterium]